MKNKILVSAIIAIIFVSVVFWNVFFSQDFLCKSISDKTQVITLYITSLSLVAVLVGFYLSIEQSRLQRQAQELETFLAIHAHAQSTLDALEDDFWTLLQKNEEYKDIEKKYDAQLVSELKKLQIDEKGKIIYYKINRYLETFDWIKDQIPATKNEKIKLRVFTEGTHQERVYRFFKSI